MRSELVLYCVLVLLASLAVGWVLLALAAGLAGAILIGQFETSGHDHHHDLSLVLLC